MVDIKQKIQARIEEVKLEDIILKQVLKKIKFHSGQDYIGLEFGKRDVEIQGIEDKDFFKIIKYSIKEVLKLLEEETA
jgi:hypothetical protein